jgi:tagatose 1,6-diphosphate aldolase
VLLDNEYGLKAALDLPGSKGLLMALEKSGYSGDSTYRQVDFIEGWTVEKIKLVGASAVKLLAYYHPETGALAEQIEGVIRRVNQDCQRFDIPLFVEPISYSLDASVARESAEFAKTRPQVAVETARRLSSLGMDILKLEFPVDVKIDKDERSWQKAVDAMSKACTVPWVLLSAGVDFDVFERQTRIACQAGASGFLAGRAIWKEAVAMEPSEREQFVKATAANRLGRLAEITAMLARPWTDFYKPIAPAKDWYLQSYPERV